jgi:phosphosulfolactate phosphohydrolase-like enzyme
VLCAGRSGQFGLDDAYCTGRLLLAVLDGQKDPQGLNDAARASLDLVRRYGERWQRPLKLSAAGQDLVNNQLGEDIVEAAQLDVYPILPHFAERRISAELKAP